MLPQFPKFKKLELSDKEAIEKITSKFAPYSDFNFVSMWSWDIKGGTMISQLHGNFVARFNDYVTEQLFYSFLGNSKVNETAKAILNLSVKEGLEAKLKLVPKDAAKALDRGTFQIEQQRDHFDYVVSVERLMPHEGTERKLSSRRRLIKKFKESHAFEVREIDIRDSDIQNKIKNVFIQWEMQLHDSATSIEHLRVVVERLFAMNDYGKIKSFGVFMDKEMIGYSVNELCPNRYAIGHFQQGNLKAFRGIYALLMHEAAPFFHDLGCEYINIEQDLDIPGLRKWKSSHKPIIFFKKYTVAPVGKL